MAMYEITHINDLKYKRKERVFFGVGNTVTEDCENLYDNNIKEKNPYYCELTAIYSIWKNKTDNFIGIEHYRRTFLDTNCHVLNDNVINKILKKNKLILPNVLETNYSQYEMYAREHSQSDYEILREVIRTYHPNYFTSFEKFFKGKKVFLFNMIVCNKEIFDHYCEWLFDVLEKVENENFDTLKNRSKYQQRVYGFMAERLLNVWVMKNFKYSEIYQLPVKMYEDGKPIIKHKFIYSLKYKYNNIIRKFKKW